MKAPRFAPVAVANVTFTTLLPWLLVVTFGWHSLQATGLYTAPAAAGFTCPRCVPTRTPVAAPSVSFGGEEAWFRSAPATLTRPVAPWHEVQVVGVVTVMVPSMWVASAAPG